jgi:hypothetical protein
LKDHAAQSEGKTGKPCENDPGQPDPQDNQPNRVISIEGTGNKRRNLVQGHFSCSEEQGRTGDNDEAEAKDSRDPQDPERSDYFFCTYWRVQRRTSET